MIGDKRKRIGIAGSGRWEIVRVFGVGVADACGIRAIAGRVIRINVAAIGKVADLPVLSL